MNTIHRLIAIAGLLALPLGAAAQTDGGWPRFRGPDGNNAVAGLEHPAQWGERDITWTAAVPGGGWSSPIVVGRRVLVSTAVAEDGFQPRGFRDGVRSPATRGSGARAPEAPVDFRVHCYGLNDGRLLWETSVGRSTPRYGIHPSNSFATESPATDGTRLFVTFGGLGEVAALSIDDGSIAWRVKTGVFPTSADFGWGSALVVHDGRVFVQSDNEKRSFMLALDAKTGRRLWEHDRGRGTSWASPTLWRRGNDIDLVALGRGTAIGYDPATGDIRWALEGLGGSFSASPTVAGERVYFGNSGPGRAGPLMAIDASVDGRARFRRGEDAPEGMAWRLERAGPGFASPVVAGDFLFVLNSRGVLCCYDTETGERHYRSRLPKAASIVATPWTDGERLFVLDETGKTFVVRVGKTFELEGTNEIDGLFWATPSVAGRHLLLREGEKLICIRGRRAL